MVGEMTFAKRMQKNDKEDDEEEEEEEIDEQSPLSKSLEMLAKYLVFVGCMCSLFMFIVLELYLIREIEEL